MWATMSAVWEVQCSTGSVVQAALEQAITVRACIAWHSHVCLVMLQVGYWLCKAGCGVHEQAGVRLLQLTQHTVEEQEKTYVQPF